MSSTAGNLPNEWWAAVGVIIGAVVTCGVTFVNAMIQRRADREKLMKVWLLDEGLSKALAHFMLFNREIASASTTAIYQFIEKSGGLMELDLLSARYDSDWALRYEYLLSSIKKDLDVGKMDRVQEWRLELIVMQNEIVVMYEWQSRHLLAKAWFRKRAFKQQKAAAQKSCGRP